LGAAMAAACAPRTAPARGAPSGRFLTFTDVQPILRENCEHCHNDDKDKGGLMVISYETLMAGGDHGSVVIPRDSASSRLVQMVEGRTTPRMPYKDRALTAADVLTLRKWIDQGALPPSAAESSTGGVVDAPPVEPKVPVTGAIAAVAFDPTGHLMAVGGYRTVHVMTLADRKWGAALNGHADLIRALAFSPDGRRLAVAGGPSGRFGEVKIWDLSATPKVVSTIQGHTDTILAIAFAPDGATIATASYDKLVKLWDVSTGKLVKTLKEHSDAVFALAFMPSGKQLVSGAGDRTLKVWDVASGKRLVTINDALDSEYAVAVNPAGTQIAAAGADRMIRTWSWNGQAATLGESAFAHGDAVLRLSYSPDGSALVSAGADRTIKVWDARSLHETQTFEPQPDWVMGLALSRDGRWLAAGRYDGTLGLYAFDGGSPGEEFVVPR
ncbi:MAG TPA: c-type cytochrome domain-containing protein, partial [Vicinamibacterales bacterium]